MSPRTPNDRSDLPGDLIGCKEAAKLIPSARPGRGTHVSTVLRWVLSGRLRGWRVNRRLLVSRTDVLGLIRPVEVELRPEVRAEVEQRQRDEETDRILREAGIRR